MTSTSEAPDVVRRHRVVIIGSGFGGLNAAKALKRADVDITLISKTTTHLFQPLLYQVATGILSEGDIAPTTRLVLRKQKNVRVLLGDVIEIDLKAQTVTSKLIDMQTVSPFDSLIVAAGAQQSYFGNDHFATYAPGMKTIDDALELRGRILGAFEAAEVATDHGRAGTPADLRGGRCRPDRRRGGRPDRRTRRAHPGRGISDHQAQRMPGDPARRRARGAAADGPEAGPQGAEAAGKDGCRGTAQCDGDHRRLQGHHHQGEGRRANAASSARARCGRPASRPARWAR